MSKKSYFSKITTKSQTVIPAAIRAKLGVGPGDQLRYVETEDGVLIEKARVIEDDPFATFSEWPTEADEKAYADL
jgi:antitoxin PrlF